MKADEGMKGLDELDGWILLEKSLDTRSEKVLRSARRVVERFLTFLGSRGVDSVYAARRADARAWVDDLLASVKEDGKPLKHSTIDKLVGRVRSFYRYLLAGEKVLEDPTRGIRRLDKRLSLPRKVLEKSEVRRLLAEPDLTKPIEYRDRVILELLYSTGLRRGEVAALELDDVDFQRGLVSVRKAKNRHARLVAIGKTALSFLAAYLEKVRPRLANETPTKVIFLGKDGDPLSAGQLGNRVKMYVLRAGVRDIHSTHSWRHTCATHMLEGGAGIRMVAEQLGHHSLDSTVIYTRVSPTGLDEAVKKWHPRERQRKEEVQEAPAAPERRYRLWRESSRERPTRRGVPVKKRGKRGLASGKEEE